MSIPQNQQDPIWCFTLDRMLSSPRKVYSVAVRVLLVSGIEKGTPSSGPGKCHGCWIVGTTQERLCWTKQEERNLMDYLTYSAMRLPSHRRCPESPTHMRENPFVKALCPHSVLSHPFSQFLTNSLLPQYNFCAQYKSKAFCTHTIRNCTC